MKYSWDTTIINDNGYKTRISNSFPDDVILVLYCLISPLLYSDQVFSSYPNMLLTKVNPQKCLIYLFCCLFVCAILHLCFLCRNF